MKAISNTSFISVAIRLIGIFSCSLIKQDIYAILSFLSLNRDSHVALADLELAMQLNLESCSFRMLGLCSDGACQVSPLLSYAPSPPCCLFTNVNQLSFCKQQKIEGSTVIPLVSGTDLCREIHRVVQFAELYLLQNLLVLSKQTLSFKSFLPFW